METQLDEIRRLSEPILASASAELVELTSRRQGGQLVIRFLVDKVGGVTIQDCARLNQLIGKVLDTSNLVDGSYTIEVFSPGLDRPLASRRDFERAIGEAIEVELLEAVRGAKRLQGTVLAVQPEAVVVTTSVGNVTIPLARIQRAAKAIQL